MLPVFSDIDPGNMCAGFVDDADSPTRDDTGLKRIYEEDEKNENSAGEPGPPALGNL